MLSLGFHRIDSKAVTTEIKTGKIVESRENWSTFDDSNHLIADGIRRNGKDSTHYIRSYRSDGKYLGEVNTNGNGRTFYYDQHDSLVRVQYLPDIPGQTAILYFYDQLDDSTTRVRQYYTDTSRIDNTKIYVRRGNTVSCTETSMSGEFFYSKRVTNQSGQIVESWDKHNDCTQRYTYDGARRMIKREIEQTYSGRRELNEIISTYDSNGNLILRQRTEKYQNRNAQCIYEFKNGLLVKETHSDPYEEPVDIITTYTYYPNGLLKTATQILEPNRDHKHVQVYTYK